MRTINSDRFQIGPRGGSCFSYPVFLFPFRGTRSCFLSFLAKEVRWTNIYVTGCTVIGCTVIGVASHHPFFTM